MLMIASHGSLSVSVYEVNMLMIALHGSLSALRGQHADDRFTWQSVCQRYEVNMLMIALHGSLSVSVTRSTC